MKRNVSFTRRPMGPCQQRGVYYRVKAQQILSGFVGRSLSSDSRKYGDI